MSLLCGCASLQSSFNSVRIDSIDWALIDLQKLVASQLPLGIGNVSSNSRVFQSKHYVMSGSRFKPAGESAERYSAQMTVLGDRRPYDLEIFVNREKRVRRGETYDYAVVDRNINLAKDLERKIRAELTKRREDRNIIDDFRVF